jgi:hypothetical protein
MISKLGPCRRFEKDSTTVSHHGIALDIFTQSLQFAAVLLNRDIHPFVGDAVTEKELESVDSSLVAFFPVNGQAAKVGGEEQFAPTLVRPPELFSQLRSSREQDPQLLRCKSNGLDPGIGFDGERRRPACEQVNVAREISGAKTNTHDALSSRYVNRSHCSRSDDKTVVRVVPGRKEWFVFVEGTPFAERRNLSKLGLAKTWKRSRIGERIKTDSEKSLRLFFFRKL